MYLLVKFGSPRSYENGDINFNISSYMSTLENIELTALVRHFERFSKSQNQEYWFTIPKSPTRLAEKPEKQEHWQLQSVLRFKKTQKDEGRQLTILVNVFDWNTMHACMLYDLYSKTNLGHLPHLEPESLHYRSGTFLW